ncbi:hypothetical protein BDF19DRAFT_437158 [Syncephalis fuscata]|nr:hypothetical protein BDF19DRAFT_437158 [Syncephalis fuscata]
MALATLCNTLCSIFPIMPISKAYSDNFFVIDWMVVTTILIHHCKNTGKNTDSAHHPKTNHILNLSQIATAK